MKRQATQIFTFITLTVLFSCGAGQKESDSIQKQETPKALEDGDFVVKSLSRSSSRDLTEELYQEIIEEMPSLKKLEDDLDVYNTKQKELEERISSFESKSENYYNSATEKSQEITDSLLRNKVLKLLNTSKGLYANKTAGYTSLMKQLALKGTTLSDHHSVLKIVLTLPIIEKFQDNKLPSKNEINELIKEQVKFIDRIDKLTPKY